MAARAHTADVRAIIDTDLEDCSAFINIATLQVDGIATLGILSADLLKQIEIWLAAHYLAIRDRQASKVTVLDSSHTYDGKTGKGLESTLWGQQALQMDSTGTLASVGRKRASMVYLGGEADSGSINVSV